MPRQYEIKSEHPVDEIFSAMRQNAVHFGKERVSITNMRLLNFFNHGVTCTGCNISGNIFRIERDSTTANESKRGGWHLNLYSKSFNKLHLMTMDHIVPRSRGGTTIMTNLQPMCEKCNSHKGDFLLEDYQDMKNFRIKKITKVVEITKVVDWSRLFSLRWLLVALKYSINSFRLPGLPKRNIKTWYHLETKNGI